jgi:hypothetical protein
VAREQEKLRLGEGAAFVKTRLKRLSQEDDTWEADFRALPKPLTQTETHYLGLVVTKRFGFLLADSHVEGRPTVNDMATLLAHAMRRPLTEGGHRPRRPSKSGATRSGLNCSRTWKNSASRSLSTGNFRRCSKPTRATCGR